MKNSAPFFVLRPTVILNPALGGMKDLAAKSVDPSALPQDDGIRFGVSKRVLLPILISTVMAVIFAVAIPGVSFASGEGAASFYNAGNAAFNSGDFNAAIDNYLKARAQGSEDARLLYNLGCAYLKAGKIGPAIQSFESARLRAPRDEDIRLNLEFARTRIKDELPETDRSLIVRLGEYPARNFTQNETVGAAAVLFTLAFLVIGIFWTRRREKKALAFIIAGLVLLALSAVATGYAVWQNADYGAHRAVIGAKELQVKSGPGLNNPNLFTVHEGLECKVREVRGTWSFIEIPTGFTGWAPNESLLPIG